MAPLISLVTFRSNWVVSLVNLYLVVWHVVVLSFNIILFMKFLCNVVVNYNYIFVYSSC